MSILDLFDSILDLWVYIWASGYRLCPDFGALQFKIGPLRVNFVLSGLKFGPLRVDFGRSRLDSVPLEVTKCKFLIVKVAFGDFPNP